MKRFSLILTAAALLVARPALAQDPATEERLNKLQAQIQDLIDGQSAFNKRLAKLSEDLQHLTERVNAGNSSLATAEDLRRLAEKVQEVDRKRENDKDAILDKLEALAKIERSIPHSPPPRSTPPPEPTTPPARADEKGYTYTVQAGDTLSIIIDAYRQQGVKTSQSEILKANPGLNPNRLRPNQKIFIPAPKS